MIRTAGLAAAVALAAALPGGDPFPIPSLTNG